MKTYQINRLLVVAAVAFLPIACGTSSVTGPDSSDATVSALRLEAPIPPQAPPQTPESDPVPEPSPKPEPSAEPDPGTIPALPTDRNGHRPAPQPDNTGVDTAPPATDRGNTGGIVVPTPPIGSPVPPSDLPVPEPPPVKCDAFTVEIATLVTFRGAGGVALEAILRNKDGGAITDLSCEKVLWTGVSGQEIGRLVITYGQDSQHVTVTGPAGTYTIEATTPNGKSASLDIVL